MRGKVGKSACSKLAVESVIGALALTSLLFSSTAAALVITSPAWFFLDNQIEVQPIIGIGGGKAITIGVEVDDIGQFQSGTATHTPSAASSTLVNIEPIFNRPYVSVDVDYDATQLLGSDWSVQVNDGAGGTASASPSRDLNGVQFIEKPMDVQGYGKLEKYTLEWQLPTTGPTFDKVQIQLFDKAANEAKFAGYFSANTTSVTADLTQFFGGAFTGEIAARVLLVNHEPLGAGRFAPNLWDIVSRSSNWIFLPPPSSSGAVGNAISLTTGSPASISQTIDTPNLPFTISFDFLFTTLTGELVVLLDGVPIGNPLGAPDTLGADFLSATFDIDNPLLLGQDDLLLTFLLDGVTASQVLIDNVSGPGILNGTFADGLTAWQIGGEGIVELISVPEPNAIMLMTLGLVGLGMLKRKRLAV